MKQSITIAVAIALTLTLTCAIQAQEQWVEAGKFGNVPGQPCYPPQNGGVPPISGHISDAPQGGPRPIVVRRTASSAPATANAFASSTATTPPVTIRNTTIVNRTVIRRGSGHGGYRRSCPAPAQRVIVTPAPQVTIFQTTTPAGDGGSNKEGGNAMPWILGIIAIIVVGGVVGWLVSVTQAAKTEQAKEATKQNQSEALLQSLDNQADMAKFKGRRVHGRARIGANGGGSVSVDADDSYAPVASAEVQRPHFVVNNNGVSAQELAAILAAQQITVHMPPPKKKAAQEKVK